MHSFKSILILHIVLSLLLSGCTQQKHSARVNTDKSISSVPEWTKAAIWYQIFVERFRNGDPSNDPTPADMAGGYPAYIPKSWKITPWGHDWYAHEPWLDSIKADGFNSKIQARRYGGDLQGVLDKLDFLQDLGINAIYFNPLNDSPSLHKYDARNYTHIDRNFGPDPKGDIALINSETPINPSTWKWTSADKLFLKVISECHKRGIRVIMDYSWNHTGKDFWALNDIRKKGNKSEFADWYNIISYDDPSTPADEFKYEGWGGNNPWMPVFKKDIIPPDDKVMPFEGNLHSESLKEYIFMVSERWLDPDKDGNPSDGVDGFRLDVAGEIPMGFWRDYRKRVREINPETYLVGEIWWLEWPDKLFDPEVYLEGDQFDAIMNYRWFRVARGFFGQAEPVLSPSGFVSEIGRINKGINRDNLLSMMNVAATHDSPRLSTSFFNKSMDKYHAKPSESPDYKINKPDELTRKEQKLLLVHQFTFIGAPHIWNGDEVGMWGADDPDCRKPIVWNDIIYEKEEANYDPLKLRPVDEVRQDTALLNFYKALCKLRKDNKVLIDGDLTFSLADDQKMVLTYTRSKSNDEMLMIFNRSDKEQTVNIKVINNGTYKEAFPGNRNFYKTIEAAIIVKLAPISSIVLKKVN